MLNTKIGHEPPFKIGDRVDHPKFGLCTVYEPLAGSHGSWKVTIEPDDQSLSRKTVHYRGLPGAKEFLTFVSSPAARGERYWRHEWEMLVEAFEKANDAKVNFIRTAFRNPQGSDFDLGLKHHQTAIVEIEKRFSVFIQEEAADLHK
ncbi:MAG: hypothetical protein ACFHHU_00555 [Porticoccaceae bacterium]